MSFSHIVGYVQYVIMLTVLQKVLSQDLKCVARLPQSYWNEPYQKLWMCVPYNFDALEINKNIVYKCMYTLHTVHIYSTSPYVH